MDGERRLLRLIADLDGAARREISLAASEGRFDDLSILAPIAKEIAALAVRWGSPPQEPPEVSRIEAVASPIVEVDPGSESPPKGAGKAKHAEYPRFLREKQQIVKLGWSPRERKPYEHRVPKKSVDRIVRAVLSCGKSGHRYTMDEILKMLTSKGTEAIPSYQTYAVVSWMKWAGLVIQHGRQGYTVVRPQTFSSSIESAWQSLPQR